MVRWGNDLQGDLLAVADLKDSRSNYLVKGESRRADKFLSLDALGTIGEADVRCDRRGVVGHCFEEGPRLKAGKVEGDNGMRHGSPSNLKVSLIAEIAGLAQLPVLEPKRA
jgi:hypothetical protein